MAPASGHAEGGAWALVVLVLVAVIIGTIVAALYATASNHPLTDQLQNAILDGGLR
jgi:hypothetical protein